MDRELHRAAAEGHIDPFKDYQEQSPIEQLLTPNRNTILHVHLEEPNEELDSLDFVDQVLDMCPSLLLQANSKGEIPLHIAARYGHAKVVRVLVDRAKALPQDQESGVAPVLLMLRTTTKLKEAALHEAVRNKHLRVVEILTKEDPDFAYSANDCGETPLYMAAARGDQLVACEILQNCTSVDYSGPSGTTALHAAVLSSHSTITRLMLEKTPRLTKVTDKNGWSALHYAADLGQLDVASVLLEFDASSAYIADNDKKRTALHMAAAQGFRDIMEVIVFFCPDCCELVDNNGWNALHYTAVRKEHKNLKNLLNELFCQPSPEKEMLSNWTFKLVNLKDNKGNTPLHLLAASGVDLMFLTSRSQLDVDFMALNHQNLSVNDISLKRFPEKQQEIFESLEDDGSGPAGNMRFTRGSEDFLDKSEKAKQKYVDSQINKAKEAHLVAATLIATVTFAAGFTLPGGYKSDDPDKGTAVLIKKAAFIAFVISDATAMVLATSAVFIHFRMAFLTLDEWTSLEQLLSWATAFNMIAMGAMVVAFITGTYVVLTPSLALAVVTSLIGFSFFVCAVRVYKESSWMKRRRHRIPPFRFCWGSAWMNYRHFRIPRFRCCW